MSALFDDMARIIASPISRREVFRLVSGALGGAVIAALGLGRTSQGWGAPAGGPQATAAAACRPPLARCPSSGSPSTCCDSTIQKCCTDKGAYCCPKGSTCCHGRCCESGEGESCCGTAAHPICCDRDDVCCGGKCCDKGPSPKNPCYKARC